MVTIIENHFENNYIANLQPDLVKNGAVEIRAFLVRVEKVGNKIFTIWSNLIIKKNEKRPLLVKFFKVYLMAAIWVISPIVLIFTYIAYSHFLVEEKKTEFNIYQGINLK